MREDRLHPQPGQIFLADVRPMAAPRVCHRVLHDVCANWVEVNVGSQLQQVVISIDENGLVPSLEKMPNSASAPIEPAGVSEGEIVDCDRGISDT